MNSFLIDDSVCYPILWNHLFYC